MYTTARPGMKDDDFMWDDVRNAKQTTQHQSSQDYNETSKKPYDDSFGSFGEEKAGSKKSEP